MSKNLLFSFNSISKKFSDLIVRNHQTNSFVIAINGVWGTGKTTLLENILDDLSNEDYIKVDFNAWRFSKQSKQEDIWRSLLLNIIESCRKYVAEKSSYLEWSKADVEIFTELVDNTEQAMYTAFVRESPGEVSVDVPSVIKGGLKIALKFVPWGNIGNDLVDKFLVKRDDKGEIIEGKIEKDDVDELFNIFKRTTTKINVERISCIEQFRKSLEQLLSAILLGDYSDELIKKDLTKHGKKIKMVIAIDDLDRCLPEYVLDILEAIKLFVDLPNMYFLLAMDSNIIQQGLSIRYNHISYINAKDYSEKMIDLSFNMPSILERGFKKYITSLTSNSERYILLFDVLSLALQTNLRSWNRYITRTEFNIEILKALDSSILNDNDLIAFFIKLQCLSYQWPEFFRIINNNDSYLNLESNILASPSLRAPQTNLEDIIVTLNMPKEVTEKITDKKILEFISQKPLLKKLPNKENIDILFAFDVNNLPNEN